MSWKVYIIYIMRQKIKLKTEHIETEFIWAFAAVFLIVPTRHWQHSLAVLTCKNASRHAWSTCSGFYSKAYSRTSTHVKTAWVISDVVAPSICRCFPSEFFPIRVCLRMFFLPALANTGTAPATDAASRHWAIKSSLPFCQRLNIIRAYMLARLECWGLSTNEEKKQEYQIVTRIQTIIHRLGRTQDMVKIGNIHLMKNVVLMEQILS